MLELYKLSPRNLVLVFLDVGSEERLERIRSVLLAAGAESSTRRTLLFSSTSNVTVESVCDLVQHLDQGDCVTVILDREGSLESFFVVPQRSVIDSG